MSETAEPTVDVIEVDPDAVVVNKAVLVAALVKSVMGVKKALADELESRMCKGDKKTAEIDGDKIGTVSRSFPDPTATITDRAALDAHLRSTRESELEYKYTLGDLEEVYAVLIEHSPELLTIEAVVPEWMIDVAKREALAPGRTIPGITVGRPDGNITIRPNAIADRIVAEVLGASPITLLEITGPDD
jgi:hypothetical protein